MRFCLVGASGVVVNYLIMRGLFHWLRLAYGLCSVSAYLAASGDNFVLNKAFTFHDQVRGLWPVMWQYFRFLSVILLGMAINLGALVAMVKRPGHGQPAGGAPGHGEQLPGQQALRLPRGSLLLNAICLTPA